MRLYRFKPHEKEIKIISHPFERYERCVEMREETQIWKKKGEKEKKREM